MSIYRYQALTKDGLKKEGFVLADNYECAYKTLYFKHYKPMEISMVYFVSRKITLEDLLIFFMHIDFQLKCGLCISDAIESFADFHGNKILNATVSDISDSLKKGDSISEAFEKCHSVFDSVITGLLKSAENTGKSSDVISNVLRFLKLRSDWKNNVKRALAYPIFITMIATVVLILSIEVLGPEVIALTQSFGDGEISTLNLFKKSLLPKISKVVISCLLVSIAIFLILTLIKRGKTILSIVLLKIPKIGRLIVLTSLWQFCKILYIALDAKVDFIQSLGLAIETIRLDCIKTELENIRNYIIDGYSISESFSKGNLIPNDVLMAIQVGENGNDLAGSFNHISDNQYKTMLLDIKSFGQTLSIGLTIFSGLIFILIICSLFHPIYSYIEIAAGA